LALTLDGRDGAMERRSNILFVEQPGKLEDLITIVGHRGPHYY
jgi:hypothetical protein